MFTRISSHTAKQRIPQPQSIPLIERKDLASHISSDSSNLIRFLKGLLQLAHFSESRPGTSSWLDEPTPNRLLNLLREYANLKQDILNCSEPNNNGISVQIKMKQSQLEFHLRTLLAELYRMSCETAGANFNLEDYTRLQLNFFNLIGSSELSYVITELDEHIRQLEGVQEPGFFRRTFGLTNTKGQASLEIFYNQVTTFSEQLRAYTGSKNLHNLNGNGNDNAEKK